MTTKQVTTDWLCTAQENKTAGTSRKENGSKPPSARKPGLVHMTKRGQRHFHQLAANKSVFLTMFIQKTVLLADKLKKNEGREGVVFGSIGCHRNMLFYFYCTYVVTNRLFPTWNYANLINLLVLCYSAILMCIKPGNSLKCKQKTM